MTSVDPVPVSADISATAAADTATATAVATAVAATAAGRGKTVLVTGATGNQGGATARHLLADGWHVRALVRDPASAAAGSLAAAGAELVVGDMADRESLDKAAEGVHGVFSVQPLGGSQEFAQVEVDMGVNVAEAARAAGARHLVYASVGGADRDPIIWHWQTKTRIEEHIRTLGLPYTILRPVMFMENHASRGTFGVAGATALVRIIPPGARIQVIAVDDIGALAALAFADPDRFVGRELEIAGDELTREQLVAAISRAVGRTLNLDPLPREVLAQLGLDADRSPRAGFAGWQADIPALRELHPGLMDFEAWLTAGGAERLRSLFS
jgi:uncharacterized protein YbjT (DUF2867 family)